MWILNSPLQSNPYSFIANKPIKKDFKLDLTNLSILPIGSLSFVENYNLIKLDFTDLFKIASYQNSSLISYSDLNISTSIVYIDDGVNMYFYASALYSLSSGNYYLQEDNFYDSKDLNPLYIFRPSNVTSSLYANIRYKISNIKNIRELDIFFTNPNYIFKLYLANKEIGDNLQLITKEYLLTYPFNVDTVVYIEYRYKVYDTTINKLPVFNKIVTSKIDLCKLYTHTVENPYDIDIVVDVDKSYRSLSNYKDLSFKGFIANDNYFIIKIT